MTHLQLRKLYEEFWEERTHRQIPPIPLIPKDDPTTLFTGSGMQQLVPYLLGEPHPLGEKLYNIQPCFRAQDIEQVGDNRHDTFFEMMGNWSLGSYFKKEQLEWCFEFFTQILRIRQERLHVTVFEGYKNIPADEESYGLWKKLGIPEKRIHKYGPHYNWWSRAGIPENMPAGEPGGPDSEVFYEFTDVKHDVKFGEKCHPNCDCGRFLEIGNSVFMQYKKMPDGSFAELPKKNVDFGGGVERLLAAINNDPDIFLSDLYVPIIRIIETETNKKYSDEANKNSMRIIADHIKASVFLIKNGVLPNNKEHGYFLRRILRRLTLKTRNLMNKTPSAKNIADISESILKIYERIYFDPTKDRQLIHAVVEEEIERFNRSLERGLNELNKIADIDGKTAFDLYQSFGFPLELTEEILKDRNQTVDKKQFREEFKKHQELSRSTSIGKFKGGLADKSEQTLKYHTATHLIHQALFDVLGPEVRQEGSNITNERLRFDFYSIHKPTDEKIRQAEKIVNEKINEGLNVEFKILPKTEAEKVGAKSFFREKYPEMVKVYFIGNYSKEFCGGPHVKNTKEIGKIEIYKFEKIGSNLYRIYAK